MKRFGYAMGMQLLALVVYGLAVVDMLFYPGSDLRTIVGMILAARVIEAVAGMVAGNKKAQKFLENTIAESVLGKIERQGKLASTAEVSRRYNGLDMQIDSLRGLVDTTLHDASTESASLIYHLRRLPESDALDSLSGRQGLPA